MVEDGYEFFARRQLVTLFSAPNYCGEFDNAGAMMSVDETLMCSFQVFSISQYLFYVQLFFLQLCSCFFFLNCCLVQILKPAEKKRMFAAAGAPARPATPPSKAAARK